MSQEHWEKDSLDTVRFLEGVHKIVIEAECAGGGHAKCPDTSLIFAKQDVSLPVKEDGSW